MHAETQADAAELTRQITVLHEHIGDTMAMIDDLHEQAATGEHKLGMIAFPEGAGQQNAFGQGHVNDTLDYLQQWHEMSTERQTLAMAPSGTHQAARREALGPLLAQRMADMRAEAPGAWVDDAEEHLHPRPEHWRGRHPGSRALVQAISFHTRKLEWLQQRLRDTEIENTRVIQALWNQNVAGAETDDEE